MYKYTKKILVNIAENESEELNGLYNCFGIVGCR